MRTETVTEGKFDEMDQQGLGLTGSVREAMNPP